MGCKSGELKRSVENKNDRLSLLLLLDAQLFVSLTNAKVPRLFRMLKIGGTELLIGVNPACVVVLTLEEVVVGSGIRNELELCSCLFGLVPEMCCDISLLPKSALG